MTLPSVQEIDANVFFLQRGILDKKAIVRRCYATEMKSNNCEIAGSNNCETAGC